MKQFIHTLSRAIILDQEHILLAYDPRTIPYHYYGLNEKFYYLPGGHINFKESAEQALVREIKEETGHKSVIKNFLGIIEHAWNFPGDEICCHTHEINLIFKASILKIGFTDSVAQKEDHVAFKWIPIRNLKKIDLRPTLLKKVIAEWLQFPANYAFQSTINKKRTTESLGG